MVSKSALLGFGCVALALVGCKDDEPGEPIDRAKVANAIVSAICVPFEECDCEEATQIEDADDCNDALQPIVESSTANAADLALRYHSECIGRVRGYFDVLGCDASDEIDLDEALEALYTASTCKLVSGVGRRGQPCELIGGPAVQISVGDTCAHDLFCDGTLCRPFPKKRGDYCGGAFVCPPGLRCLDPEGDGVRTCGEAADDGDSCNPHDVSPCDTDLFCDPKDAECKELPDQGENCLDFMCQEGLTCLTGICESLPGAGQPCPEGVCDPTEAVCDFMVNLCIELPTEGEMCIAGMCDEGLQCGPDQLCIESPAQICNVADSVGLCLYIDDGICDEPDIGTGLCPEGTDPFDCSGADTFDPTTPGTLTTPPTDPSITATDSSITDSAPTFTTGDPSSDSLTASGGTLSGGTDGTGATFGG